MPLPTAVKRNAEKARQQVAAKSAPYKLTMSIFNHQMNPNHTASRVIERRGCVTR